MKSISAVGYRIKQARSILKLSLNDLAAKMGVSAQAVSKWERNGLKPGSYRLLQLCDALEKPPEYFFRPITVKFDDVNISVSGTDGFPYSYNTKKRN